MGDGNTKEDTGEFGEAGPANPLFILLNARKYHV
jgi:hypothetical protein